MRKLGFKVVRDNRINISITRLTVKNHIVHKEVVKTNYDDDHQLMLDLFINFQVIKTLINYNKQQNVVLL